MQIESAIAAPDIFHCAQIWIRNFRIARSALLAEGAQIEHFILSRRERYQHAGLVEVIHDEDQIGPIN